MKTEQTLPEELVERIVAMIPFPHVFKARVLSKSWNARFSLVSSLNDEVERRIAIAFQKEVRAQSTKWGTSFPVCRDEEFYFVYYDRKSQTTIRLPMPSLPLERSFTSSHPQVLGIEGFLVLCVCWKKHNFYVANIFTGSWKKLPLRPILVGERINRIRSYARFSPMTVRGTSLEAYKVIVLNGYFTLDHVFTPHCLHIYDSMSYMWSTKKLFQKAPLRRRYYPIGRPVYLDGVAYLQASGDVNYVLACNIEEGTVEELEFSFNGIMTGNTSFDLVVCNAKLLIFVTEASIEEYPNHSGNPLYHVLSYVLKVDVESRQLLEVESVPPLTFLSRRGWFFSDGDCVFFENLDGQMVTYNVQEDNWGYLRLSPGITTASDLSGDPFRLGLDTFAEI